MLYKSKKARVGRRGIDPEIFIIKRNINVGMNMKMTLVTDERSKV